MGVARRQAKPPPVPIINYKLLKKIIKLLAKRPAAELPASVVPEVRFGASAKFPEPPTTVPSEDKAAEAAAQQTADKEKCIVM